MTTPTQGEHVQPEALRLAKYVARRKLAKQLDANEIHGFDSGCDTEAVLLLSDIEAVLARVAALTAAQPAAPQGGERAMPETLGVYCGIASDDVTDPTHPRYVAGFKAGHAAGKKRASHGQAPAATPSGAAKPAGRVYSANCEYAVVQWLHQTSDVGGGDPKNSWSWPTTGDAVYLAQPTTTAQAAPAATPQADSQPAPTGRIAELEDALSSCLQLVNQLNEHHIPDGCSRLIRHIKDAAATVSNAQARAPADSVTAPAVDDFQPCSSCFGTGVEGDADDYGRTIDVTCGECNGSGRAQVKEAIRTESVTSRYRDACTQGGRCLGGCLSAEPCYLAARATAQPAPAPAAQAADSVLEDAAPTHWAVIAPCGQGVIFPDKADAKWTKTGRGAGAGGFGYPTIGEAFRESYSDGLVMVPIHIDAARKQGANHDNA